MKESGRVSLGLSVCREEERKRRREGGKEGRKEWKEEGREMFCFIFLCRGKV